MNPLSWQRGIRRFQIFTQPQAFGEPSPGMHSSDGFTGAVIARCKIDIKTGKILGITERNGQNSENKTAIQ
jgi:hypothetical protein